MGSLGSDLSGVAEPWLCSVAVSSECLDAFAGRCATQPVHVMVCNVCQSWTALAALYLYMICPRMRYAAEKVMSDLSGLPHCSETAALQQLTSSLF